MMWSSGARSIAVVSPHLDDAALSLGATIARLAKSGATVRVVTVFAGNPDSPAAPGNWDRRGGFTSEGDAARGRRREDTVACRLLGARPVWLPFEDQQYAGARFDRDVWHAVADAVSGADLVLLPGFPLTHPDHAWLAALLVHDRLPVARSGLYVEQPYAYRVRSESLRPDLAPPLAALLPAVPTWHRCGRDIRASWSKAAAIREYTSQGPLLGLSNDRWRGLRRMLLWELRRGGEQIAILS